MRFIESVSEKPIIKEPYLARRIMPLISIHGTIYITNKIIYFKPIYTVSSKPVKKIYI